MSKEISQIIPHTYSLDFDPKWFKLEIDVEEHLDPIKNLFTQPPIAWALEDEKIFPLNALLPESFDIARVLVVNIWLRDWNEYQHRLFSRYSAGISGKKRLELLAQYLPLGYPSPSEVATKICENLTEFSKSYPGIREYLRYEIGVQHDYDIWGRPEFVNDHFRALSYPAWLEWRDRQSHVYEETRKIQRYVGIEIDAPKGFSTEEDVKEAMPAKPKLNKTYRLISSSGALR